MAIEKVNSGKKKPLGDVDIPESSPSPKVSKTNDTDVSQELAGKNHKPALEKTIDSAQEQLQNDANRIKENWNEDTLGKLKASGDAISMTVNLANKPLELTRDFSKDVIEEFRTGNEIADDIFVDGAGKTLTGGGSVVTGSVGLVGSLFSSEKGSTKKAAKEALDGLIDVKDGVVNFSSGTAKATWKGAKSLGSGAADLASGAASKTWEGVKKVGNGAKSFGLGFVGKGWLWDKYEDKKDAPPAKTQEEPPKQEESKETEIKPVGDNNLNSTPSGSDNPLDTPVASLEYVGDNPKSNNIFIPAEITVTDIPDSNDTAENNSHEKDKPASTINSSPVKTQKTEVITIVAGDGKSIDFTIPIYEPISEPEKTFTPAEITVTNIPDNDDTTGSAKKSSQKENKPASTIIPSPVKTQEIEVINITAGGIDFTIPIDEPISEPQSIQIYTRDDLAKAKKTLGQLKYDYKKAYGQFLKSNLDEGKTIGAIEIDALVDKELIRYCIISDKDTCKPLSDILYPLNSEVKKREAEAFINELARNLQVKPAPLPKNKEDFIKLVEKYNIELGNWTDDSKPNVTVNSVQHRTYANSREEVKGLLQDLDAEAGATKKSENQGRKRTVSRQNARNKRGKSKNVSDKSGAKPVRGKVAVSKMSSQSRPAPKMQKAAVVRSSKTVSQTPPASATKSGEKLVAKLPSTPVVPPASPAQKKSSTVKSVAKQPPKTAPETPPSQPKAPVAKPVAPQAKPAAKVPSTPEVVLPTTPTKGVKPAAKLPPKTAPKTPLNPLKAPVVKPSVSSEKSVPKLTSTPEVKPTTLTKDVKPAAKLPPKAAPKTPPSQPKAPVAKPVAPQAKPAAKVPSTPVVPPTPPTQTVQQVAKTVTPELVEKSKEIPLENQNKPDKHVAKYLECLPLVDSYDKNSIEFAAEKLKMEPEALLKILIADNNLSQLADGLYSQNPIRKNPIYDILIALKDYMSSCPGNKEDFIKLIKKLKTNKDVGKSDKSEADDFSTSSTQLKQVQKHVETPVNGAVKQAVKRPSTPEVLPTTPTKGVKPAAKLPPKTAPETPPSQPKAPALKSAAPQAKPEAKLPSTPEVLPTTPTKDVKPAAKLPPTPVVPPASPAQKKSPTVKSVAKQPPKTAPKTPLNPPKALVVKPAQKSINITVNSAPIPAVNSEGNQYIGNILVDKFLNYFSHAGLDDSSLILAKVATESGIASTQELIKEMVADDDNLQKIADALYAHKDFKSLQVSFLILSELGANNSHTTDKNVFINEIKKIKKKDDNKSLNATHDTVSTSKTKETSSRTSNDSKQVPAQKVSSEKSVPPTAKPTSKTPSNPPKATAVKTSVKAVPKPAPTVQESEKKSAKPTSEPVKKPTSETPLNPPKALVVKPAQKSINITVNSAPIPAVNSEGNQYIGNILVDKFLNYFSHAGLDDSSLILAKVATESGIASTQELIKEMVADDDNLQKIADALYAHKDFKSLQVSFLILSELGANNSHTTDKNVFINEIKKIKKKDDNKSLNATHDTVSTSKTKETSSRTSNDSKQVPAQKVSSEKSVPKLTSTPEVLPTTTTQDVKPATLAPAPVAANKSQDKTSHIIQTPLTEDSAESVKNVPTVSASESKTPEKSAEKSDNLVAKFLDRLLAKDEKDWAVLNNVARDCNMSSGDLIKKLIENDNDLQLIADKLYTNQDSKLTHKIAFVLTDIIVALGDATTPIPENKEDFIKLVKKLRTNNEESKTNIPANAPEEKPTTKNSEEHQTPKTAPEKSAEKSDNLVAKFLDRLLAKDEKDWAVLNNVARDCNMSSGDLIKKLIENDNDLQLIADKLYTNQDSKLTHKIAFVLTDIIVALGDATTPIPENKEDFIKLIKKLRTNNEESKTNIPANAPVVKPDTPTSESQQVQKTPPESSSSQEEKPSIGEKDKPEESQIKENIPTTKTEEQDDGAPKDIWAKFFGNELMAEMRKLSIHDLELLWDKYDDYRKESELANNQQAASYYKNACDSLGNYITHRKIMLDDDEKQPENLTPNYVIKLVKKYNAPTSAKSSVVQKPVTSPIEPDDNNSVKPYMPSSERRPLSEELQEAEQKLQSSRYPTYKDNYLKYLKGESDNDIISIAIESTVSPGNILRLMLSDFAYMKKLADVLYANGKINENEVKEFLSKIDEMNGSNEIPYSYVPKTKEEFLELIKKHLY